MLATFLPLWESRTMLVTIFVKAITCNKADPDDMHKFGSFMSKPGVPRVQARSLPSLRAVTPHAHACRPWRSARCTMMLQH